MDAEQRDNAIQVLKDAMLQAGVDPDDAEKAAPLIIDHGPA